jgi:hypothetical protein
MENRRKNYGGIAFWEYEIMLAKKMLDELRTPMEFLYYLMEHRDRTVFSIILISSDHPRSMIELQQMKRGTDILFELDKDHGTFAMICQSTDAAGGEEFAKLLLKSLRQADSETYCILSSIDSSENSVQDVVFKMVETYLHAKKTNQSEEVVVSTLD